MAYIMAKRGMHDNIVTYEHYCDYTSDLPNIPKEYSTLGSVAIVIHGEAGGLEVYIADSNEEWVAFAIGSNGSGSSEITTHICAAGEYDTETLMPTITNPEEGIFYFVPNNKGTYDRYDEWVYNNGQWERFGTDFTITIPQSDWNQSNESAVDYIKNRICYDDSTVIEILEYDITFNTKNNTLAMETNSNPFSAAECLEKAPAGSEVNLTFTAENQVVQLTGDVYRYGTNEFPTWQVQRYPPDSNVPFTFVVQDVSNSSGSTVRSVINADVTTNLFPLEEGTTYHLVISRTISDLKQIDQKFIPNSDWEQNDESGIGYIKNKPFYTITNVVGQKGVIIFEQSISFQLVGNYNVSTGTFKFANDSYYLLASELSNPNVDLILTKVVLSDPPTTTDYHFSYYDGNDSYVRYSDSNNTMLIRFDFDDNRSADVTIMDSTNSQFVSGQTYQCDLASVSEEAVNVYTDTIQTIDAKYIPRTLKGNLTITGNSLTIGSTTVTEEQLQQLLALLN